ncbi:GntR family transcriptional regulator [Paenibacillus sp. sgz500958]|uniref:GntR family transcriptional regulator n=1 Tax=Paenibacillus sp. sgz500958 TaxID=3242475 RepID=UPI0036D3BAF9
MNKQPIQPIQPIKRTSFRDEVYRTLREAIISLALEPGQRLNDNQLASQFGVSRTPVREALKRLEDEGLVETVPGSITRVALLRPEEAGHAFVVAAALHALGARLAIPRLTESHLEMMRRHNEEFRQAIDTSDILAAIHADDDFHNILIEASGNPDIKATLERIMPKLRRLEISRFASEQAIESLSDHEQIIAACEQGDVQSASLWSEKNWLNLGTQLGMSNTES